MDPQATWDDLLDSWKEEDWDSVLTLSEALIAWLDKGGFPPATTNRHRVGSDWNRIVSQAVCRFARLRAASVLQSPHGVPPDVEFIVACEECDITGPDTLDQALDDGWTDIRHTPTSALENFRAFCPDHAPKQKGGTSCPI